jgi:uncharacterized protein (TIGR02421 family)
MPILSASAGITDEFVADVRARLQSGGRIRRKLPGDGRLHMDRRLPFLWVHRERADDADGATRLLVSGEAAHLVAPAAGDLHGDLAKLVTCVADVMVEQFGAFLLLELWVASSSPRAAAPASGAGPGSARGDKRSVRRATFRVMTPSLAVEDDTVRELTRALAEIPLRPPPLDVEVDDTAPPRPADLPALLDPNAAAAPGARFVIGVEVQPIYRQAAGGGMYPVLFEILRRGLSLAFRQTAFHFAVTHTTHEPPHFHALGRRVAARAAANVDAALAEIARTFDFLLQVTPVNVIGARTRFLGDGAQHEPVFDYRPLAVDVDVLKRRLYIQPIEALEDPTLAHLLRDSRDMIDRMLTMLADRNTPRFRYGSLALYGSPSDELLRDAGQLLESLHPDARDDLADASSGAGDGEAPSHVGAREFAKLAEAEVARYRAGHPAFAARVHVRGDVSGLVVSRGDLLIDRQLRVPAHRVEPLLHHEIGTHVLTYYNGLAQPLEQLALGLAGYEELQEGLAVLAEYLAGGLTRDRLRLLAARVLAVQRVVEGASFVELFRELTATHGFGDHVAFTIVMRVHRSGGFAKDVVYLRGLAELLAHLRGGGDLEVLYTGKIALRHRSIVEELRWRDFLRPPPLRPRYLAAEGAASRLAQLRTRGSLAALVPDLLP